MIHLSSYHSNGLPPVVWSNKVNLIGEKVYKPKIHFCEYCNKPILIYGRLIPCKHVFCFTCATLCVIQAQKQSPTNVNPTSVEQPSDINQPSQPLDSNYPNDMTNSPHLNGNTNLTNGGSEDSHQSGSNNIKGCHRCGNRALRVERNTLNSIFVCQVDTCKRTYLSARDLQAHVNHRHSRNTNRNSNNNLGPMSASMHALSSSPYISSSTLMHLNGHQQSVSNNSHNSPNSHNHQHQNSLNHRKDQERAEHNRDHREKERDRFRERDRDNYQRERERERNSKEYHRQSMQRAAQWAEASAQLLEKGLMR